MLLSLDNRKKLSILIKKDTKNLVVINKNILPS